MSAINGIYNHKSFVDVENKVKLMNSLNWDRVSDFSNTYLDSMVCLGHNGLSIIDLDSKSNQPFISLDKNIVLSFDGVIYNLLELKKELSKSYKLKTEIDTEVIIAAYQKWGIEMVHKFNGMFSFALWDKVKEELFLCRDRFGNKPLYYLEDNQSILFSSSIKAIKSFYHKEISVKEDDLIDFLQYGTVHQPNTILSDIKSVPRSSFLIIGNQETKIFEYWNLFENSKPNNLSLEPSKKIKKILLESVKKRLVSDVPHGIFLSGDISSSTLVSVASKVSNEKINTFSLFLKENSGEERKFSRILAKKYKTNHFELELNSDDILHQIEEPFKFMEHPSTNGISTFFISKLVHEKGFKMALSSVGADELFVGSSVFKQVLELENKKWLYSFPPQLRNVFGKLLQRNNKSLKSQKFAETLNLKLFELSYYYPVLRKIFTNNTINELTDFKSISSDNYPFNWALNEISPKNRGSNFPLISKISALEIETYLQNVLLRDSEQMGMANSLEIRFPFLDNNLVEYVLSLPDELKHSTYYKKLLVDLTREWIPSAIIERDKIDFVLPLEKWMKNELNFFCKESISNLKYYPQLNMRKINLLWKDFLKGNTNISWLQMWTLVVLGKWTADNISINKS